MRTSREGSDRIRPEGSERIRLTVGDLVFDARAAGPEDGELVLLLHGFPQTSYEWRRQLPVLAEMGFRAVAPDQRGYSPGARPREVEEYAIPHLVSDVLGFAEALGRETFHLVGHDWGATVAWCTAALHPERARSLVAVSVPHPLAFLEALRSPTGEQARMSAYMEDFRAVGAEERLLADAAGDLRRLLAASGFPQEGAGVYLEALGTREALGAALAWYRALDFEAASEVIGPVRVPTLYVWSTEDVALGREGAETTERHVEGPYRFEVLEGVSHWVPEEAAEALNALLREHFTRYGADGD